MISQLIDWIEISWNLFNQSSDRIILILIPQYILFIIVGFETYVISLSLLDQYLTNLIAKKYAILIQAIAHFLCIIGIYLGRFERFNSWDLVTKPGEVFLKTGEDLFDIWKLLTLAIAFLLIWLLSSFIMLTNNKLEYLLLGYQRQKEEVK